MATTEERATYSATNNPRGRVVALVDLRASGDNARTTFDEAKLVGLAESIRDHGLLQPLVVRATTDDEEDAAGLVLCPGYTIIAGERRFRALWLLAYARAMGEPIAEVVTFSPETLAAWREQAGQLLVDVRDFGDLDERTALELMLVENLQRQDLDPIEEAEGYRQLNRVVGLTQAAIAAAVKRSQPAVANAMRLLELPEDVRALISAGELSVSHGIALAKWAPWPEFARGVAELAAAENWTSKSLDKLQPDDYRVSNARRYLDSYSTSFDQSVCAACPFQARWTDTGGRGYCLRPSHYDQLNAQARQEKEAAEAARVASLVTDAKATEGALPKVGEMGHGSYRHLDAIPIGCSADCPCRTAALAYSGSQTVVCIDPKRFDKLQADQKRAEQKAQRELKARRLGLVTVAADAVTDGAPRDLVLLVEHLVLSVGVPVLRDALKRQGIDLDAEQLRAHYKERSPKRFRALHRLSETRLLRLGVELVLRQDVENQFAEYKVGGYIMDWYLQAGTGADDAAPAEGGEDAS